jgi:hypothetical protein
VATNAKGSTRGRGSAASGWELPTLSGSESESAPAADGVDSLGDEEQELEHEQEQEDGGWEAEQEDVYSPSSGGVGDGEVPGEEQEQEQELAQELLPEGVWDALERELEQEQLPQGQKSEDSEPGVAEVVEGPHDGAQMDVGSEAVAAKPEAADLLQAVPVSPGPSAAPSVCGASDFRGRADAVVEVDHGNIRWYARSRRFVATCRNAAHGRCVKQKTISSRVGRGRPLGLLAAWLERAFEFDSQEAHTSVGALVPRQERQAARQRLRQVRGSASLFDAELRPEDGLESEPDELP